MRENVVIIMADQLRYDVLGRGFTPNIDSIREGGVDFTRAYCACPLCVPARGAYKSMAGFRFVLRLSS